MDSNSGHGLSREGGWQYSRADASNPSRIFAPQYKDPYEYRVQHSNKDHIVLGIEEDNERMGIEVTKIVSRIQSSHGCNHGG